MIIKKSNLFFIIILFGIAIFFSVVPLESIKKNGFVDRENYINYLTYYNSRSEVEVFITFYDYITKEWLWHKFIFFLKDFFYLSPNLIFSLISLFCFFIASLIIFKKTNSLIYVLFLVNPIFIDFYYSQLRLAFAFAIWGLAYLLIEKYKKISLALIGLAFLIHTSSVLFISLGFLAYFATVSKMNNYMKLIFLCLLGFFTSIITGPLRATILSYFGDRRAEYSDMNFDIIFSSFWIFLLFSMILNHIFFKKNLKSYEAYSIIFLSLIFLNYFIGGYSSRFLAATYPFLIISLYYLKSNLRIFCITFYIFYSFILSYYWIF